MSKLFPNATPRTRAPFRFDIVGSFLRPEALKQARHQCACGECTPEYAEEITDKAVLDLIAKEKKVGLPNVTDGEFRRTWWHLDFLFNLNNVELRDTETYSTKFQAHMHRPVTLVITDKVEWNKDHPFFGRLQTPARRSQRLPNQVHNPSTQHAAPDYLRAHRETRIASRLR